jgi:hypothetical protein
MSFREREALLARIRQLGPTASKATRPATPPMANSEHDSLDRLDVRITHLEHQLQGLQDSIHRESLRQSKRIAELEARIQPGTLNKALSEDARERGL